jgi:hypothetical protein
VTTYEEWRVTGTPPTDGFETYECTWSSAHNANAETGARDYVTWARTKDWPDGPHLHKRTVTVTDWTEVDT